MVTAVVRPARLVPLVAASFAWLAVVFGVALTFDVPEFAQRRRTPLVRRLGADRGRARACSQARTRSSCSSRAPAARCVPGIGGALALCSSAAGIALISPAGDVVTSTWIGWRLLAPAAVFAALSAGVFRIERHRDLATIMWALAAVALLGSEWLVVQDPTWRAVAFAATAAALALLEKLLAEARFWFAGWGLALGTAAGVGLGGRPAVDARRPQPARPASALLLRRQLSSSSPGWRGVRAPAAISSRAPGARDRWRYSTPRPS